MALSGRRGVVRSSPLAAHRCCGESLMESALACVGARGGSQFQAFSFHLALIFLSTSGVRRSRRLNRVRIVTPGQPPMCRTPGTNCSEGETSRKAGCSGCAPNGAFDTGKVGEVHTWARANASRRSSGSTCLGFAAAMCDAPRNLRISQMGDERQRAGQYGQRDASRLHTDGLLQKPNLC